MRMFVKDSHLPPINEYGPIININQANVERWFQLPALTIGDGNHEQGFDSTKIHAMGISIATSPGSTLNFKGQLYIDACTIGR